MTGRPPRPVRERLMAAVVFKDGGCWEFRPNARTPTGYRQISVGQADGRSVAAYAHRVSYELHVGPVPDGLQLDHLCRVRHCVNPDHLEPVTAQENRRRAAALITECAQGHPYDEENTAHYGGQRVCKTCKRSRALAYYYANRETA